MNIVVSPLTSLEHQAGLSYPTESHLAAADATSVASYGHPISAHPAKLGRRGGFGNTIGSRRSAA
jgi:hypothetical protein